MVKKYFSYLLLIFLFVVGLSFVSKVFADENKDGVKITVISSEGIGYEEDIIIGDYGKSINIALSSLSDYHFNIFEGAKNTDNSIDFLVSKSTNLIVVTKDSSETVKVFIDTNGRLVDFKYDDNENYQPEIDVVSKPGYNHTGWKAIDSEKEVFVATYERHNDDLVRLNIVGGTANPDEPTYNDLVTLTPTNSEDFSYWVDEEGVVVSTNPNYTFTAMYENGKDEIFLEAIHNESPITDSFVYLRDVTGIRDVYHSFLGYINLSDDDNLIEYGILVGDDETIELTLDNNKKIIPSTSLFNNEFLRSFVNSEFTNYRAYIKTTKGTYYSEHQHPELAPYYVLDFENYSDNTWGYATTEIIHEGLYWNVKEGRVDFDDSDKFSATEERNGEKVLRFRGGNTAYLESEVLDSVTTITFDAKFYNSSHSDSIMTVSYQLEGTSEWILVETISLTDSYVLQEIDINQGNVKIRIDVTKKTANIDNLKIYGENIPKGRHEVTFEANSSEFAKVTVIENEKVAAPLENPSIANHTFIEWRLEGEEEAFDFNTPITNDITLVAHFEINKYELTLPQGVVSNKGTLIAHGEQVTLTITEPEGEKLEWLKVNDSIVEVDDLKYTFIITGETIIDVSFIDDSIDQATITFKEGYGDNETHNTKIVIVGDELTDIPEDPIRDGYYFLGWFVDVDDEISFDFDNAIEKDLTLIAKWHELTFFNAKMYYEGGTGNMGSSPINNASSVHLDPLIFNVLSDKGEASNQVGYNAAGNIRIYGERNSGIGNTLTIKINENYLITNVIFTFGASSNSPVGKLMLGSDLINMASSDLRETSKTYRNLEINELSLQNVQNEGSKNAQIYITSIEITYRFADPFAKTHNVNFAVNGNNYDSQSIFDGELATIPSNPTPPANHTFVEWRLNGVKFEFDTPITSDIILVAHFELNKYVLDLPESITADKTSPIEHGTIVTLTIDIPDNYKISSLLINNVSKLLDVDENNTLQLEITEDTEVLVDFVLEGIETFNVSFVTNGGTVPSTQNITKNNLVMKPDNPTREGYMFERWYLDDVEFDFDSHLVTESIELEAKWYIVYKETFDNFKEAGSYKDGEFNGTNNQNWAYTLSRGDQSINGTAWTTSTGYLQTTFSNGLSYLSFDYSRAFTGTKARTFNIYINGTLIDTITVDPESDTTITYINTDLNYSGSTVLKIEGTGVQKKLDNLRWISNTSADYYPQ